MATFFQGNWLGGPTPHAVCFCLIWMVVPGSSLTGDIWETRYYYRSKNKELLWSVEHTKKNHEKNILVHVGQEYFLHQ